MLFEDLSPVIYSLASIALIGFAVFTNNGFIGALAQIGDLQTRQSFREKLGLSEKPKVPTISTVVAEPNVTSAKRASSEIALSSSRVAFTVGVINVCMTCFLLGIAPTKLYLWITPKAVVLISARWWDFRKQKKHYLLFDFCYWVNFLLLTYMWYDSHNTAMFRILFMMCNGPLAFSILAFNQSLIFHSWQHITSVFIHTSPMLFTFGLRWFAQDQPERFTICDQVAGAVSNSAFHDPHPECRSVSSLGMVSDALVYFYLPWLILYYLWIFVALGHYIEKRGFETLYDRVTTSGPLSGILKSVNAHHLIKKAIYLGFHCLFGVLTMFNASILFYNFWLHLAFCLAITSASAWNASGFYFSAFIRQMSTGTSCTDCATCAAKRAEKSK